MLSSAVVAGIRQAAYRSVCQPWGLLLCCAAPQHTGWILLQRLSGGHAGRHHVCPCSAGYGICLHCLQPRLGASGSNCCCSSQQRKHEHHHTAYLVGVSLASSMSKLAKSHLHNRSAKKDELSQCLGCPLPSLSGDMRETLRLLAFLHVCPPESLIGYLVKYDQVLIMTYTGIYVHCCACVILLSLLIETTVANENELNQNCHSSSPAGLGTCM